MEGGEKMKVINPLGRTMELDTYANYEGVSPKGGCICYQSDTNADAKGLNILCIGCRSNCFSGNYENNVANQSLAESKTIL